MDSAYDAASEGSSNSPSRDSQRSLPTRPPLVRMDAVFFPFGDEEEAMVKKDTGIFTLRKSRSHNDAKVPTPSTHKQEKHDEAKVKKDTGIFTLRKSRSDNDAKAPTPSTHKQEKHEEAMVKKDKGLFTLRKSRSDNDAKAPSPSTHKQEKYQGIDNPWFYIHQHQLLQVPKRQQERRLRKFREQDSKKNRLKEQSGTPARSTKKTPEVTKPRGLKHPVIPQVIITPPSMEQDNPPLEQQVESIRRFLRFINKYIMKSIVWRLFIVFLIVFLVTLFVSSYE